MVLCMFIIFGFSDCIPKDLVLRNGEVLRPDCGWSVTDNQVLVRFENHHFYIQKTWVDWQATQESQNPGGHRNQASKEDQAWQRLVTSSTSEKPEEPVVLDNQRLQEFKASGAAATARKKSPTKAKINRTDYLIRLIKQLEEQREALHHQLDGEISWQQAKFLMAQVDRLEQMLKEKRYWLRRLRDENNRLKKATSQPGETTEAIETTSVQVSHSTIQRQQVP